MTAATVHRRHRKDAKLAAERREGQLAALERRVLHEIDQRPVEHEPGRVWVPLKERPPKPTKPGWMLDPKAELAWLRAFVANRTAHHATHSHLHIRDYWWAVARGVAKAYRRSHDYVVMPDKIKVLVELTNLGQTKDHDDMSDRYDEIRKRRGRRAQEVAGAVGTLVAAALVGLTLWQLNSETDPDVGTLLWDFTVAVVLLALVSTPGFALYGRRPKTAKAPSLKAADARAKVEPRPTADVVHAAFAAAGIDGIACEVAPHREGPGWETLIRIPVGRQTFADAVKAADAIAGNLGIDRDCLALSPVRGHGGSAKHVRVWWSNADPFAGDPPPHPLLDPRNVPADLWNDGLPIGIDARGTVARIAVVDTPFAAILGQPGAGKTFLFFGIGAAIAADPLWDLDCWAFKASGSFAPLKPLVTASGGTFDYGADAKTFDRFHRYLVRLQGEIAQRNATLDGLPIDRNPHDKVERDVAADRALGLRPRVVFADEIITAIEGDKRILPVLEEIARTIRSLHIVFVLGAQFADSDTFKNLQKLLGARIVLSVARHNDSELALGGFHIPGLTDAHRIPLSAKGVAYLGGAIDDAEVGARPAFKIRTFGIDRARLAEHVNRCLTGPRAEQGASPRLSLVKDTEDPFKARLTKALNGDEALWSRTLAERLGYGADAGATARLHEALRRDGIEPRIDRTGTITGGRERPYIHRDQLDGHHR